LRSYILCLVLAFALFAVVSCSGGGESITAPAPEHNAVSEANGGTLCMGLWQVVINKDGTGDIVRLRAADQIINVLGFMEPPALVLMNLDWDTLDIDFDAGTIEVGVVLTHPIAGDPVFTGFDCRGVCFGPNVTNADGWTIIPSPEFFKGVPFGYQDGLVGAPDELFNYEGLAGYKYFCDGLGRYDDLVEFFSDPLNVEDRGQYGAGNTNTRQYSLEWNTVSYDFLVFNYAIYANYNWPLGEPPVDLEDFDITTANSAEAFCVSVTETANSLWYTDPDGGGNISLQVEVWDWQGDITDVMVESDAVGIAPTSYDTYLGSGGEKRYIYEFNDVPALPTSTGEHDILITAVDMMTFGGAWFMDLLPPENSMYDELVYNCFLHTTTVIACAPPVPTDITPSAFACYPGTYDDVLIDGEYFELAGGVTDVYLTDDTTEIHATDITVLSDTQLTCDFDFFSDAPDCDTGLYDVVVVTACEGVGEDLADVTNNILYYQDFADGDGDCSGTWSYCSSTGRWEESSCGSNYSSYSCRKFMTPTFNVPSTSEVHYRMRSSWNIEYYGYDGTLDGWTTNGGATMRHYQNGSMYRWNYESGQQRGGYYYFWAPYFYVPSCVGSIYYYWGSYNCYYARNYGSLGTGVWTQCGHTGYMIGSSNVQFMLAFMSDSSVQYRGHEVYELLLWYDV
jgi:hypothetical protein